MDRKHQTFASSACEDLKEERNDAYAYPVSRCHVRRTELPRLRAFRERLSVWNRWLYKDQHSVWRQIHAMLWNDMIFRTINECRRIAKGSPSNGVFFNSDVARFIDQSYVSSQLLSIRRLTESNRRSDADAITLPRLLEDLKEHAALFTREIYVCHNGLPFDPNPPLRRHAAEAVRSGGASIWGMPTSGPEAYFTAIRTHEHFDRLTGTCGRTWCRDDKLDPHILVKLRSKLGCCGALNKVASKFIAHAADAKLRSQINEQERRVTLDRIEACHRIICRVATYISLPLLDISGTDPIPTPQYNHLEHLDKAWVEPTDLTALARFWSLRAEKVEKWAEGDWQQILGLPG